MEIKHQPYEMNLKILHTLYLTVTEIKSTYFCKTSISARCWNSGLIPHGKWKVNSAIICLKTICGMTYGFIYKLNTLTSKGGGGRKNVNDTSYVYSVNLSTKREAGGGQNSLKLCQHSLWMTHMVIFGMSIILWPVSKAHF